MFLKRLWNETFALPNDHDLSVLCVAFSHPIGQSEFDNALRTYYTSLSTDVLCDVLGICIRWEYSCVRPFWEYLSTVTNIDHLLDNFQGSRRLKLLHFAWKVGKSTIRKHYKRWIEAAIRRQCSMLWTFLNERGFLRYGLTWFQSINVNGLTLDFLRTVCKTHPSQPPRLSWLLHRAIDNQNKPIVQHLVAQGYRPCLNRWKCKHAQFAILCRLQISSLWQSTHFSFDNPGEFDFDRMYKVAIKEQSMDGLATLHQIVPLRNLCKSYKIAYAIEDCTCASMLRFLWHHRYIRLANTKPLQQRAVLCAINFDIDFATPADPLLRELQKQNIWSSEFF